MKKWRNEEISELPGHARIHKKKRIKNDNKIPNFRNDEKILPITNQMNLFL